MLRATWKSLLSHKLRLTATALSVVLGVGFVAGAYVLTDAMNDAFDDLFGEIISGVDVSVRGEQAFASSAFGPPGASQRPPVPEDVVPQIAAVEGVAAVEPTIEGYAQLVVGGEPIGGNGPPTIGVNAPAVPELSTMQMRDGRLPERAGEIAIDAGTAQSQDLSVGDTVGVATIEAVQEATIVGTVGFGELDSLMGATLVLFDTPTAAQVLAPEGGYSSVEVLGEAGVEREALRDRIAEAVGAGYEVLTGEALAQDAAAEIKEGIGFLTTFLLVFAGVALFVGAFLIANTFSIIVAQRTRELALLRAVGASRRQVLGSVLGEALVTGMLGSLGGLGLGFGVAVGLTAFMDALGMELPTAALVLQPRTVVVALVVGIGVTVVSALVPALRATRVLPVAALQAVAAPPPPASGSKRTIVGVVLAAVGIGLLALGLFGGGGIQSVGAGAVVFLLAAAILSPLVTRPVVAALGIAARRRGAAGDLATRNAARNPRRTASTAAALMIGLGLVSFVLIFATSIKVSTDQILTDVFRADYTLGAQDGFTPVSPRLAERVGALDEVAVAAPQRVGQFRYDGKMLFLGAFDMETLDQIFNLELVDGSIRDAHEAVMVSEKVATAEGWEVGDRAPLEFALTGVQQVPIAGIFDASSIDTDFVAGMGLFEANFADRMDQRVYVVLADGVDPEAARPAIEAVAADFPIAQVQDQTQFREQVAQQINQLLALIFGLLGLSVIIAFFGIANTLGLTVYERIRELGLLRAVGMTRRQVRTMVRWEAILIAALGAVLGIAVGFVFAWMLRRALADEGLVVFAVPYGQLLASVLFAGLAGVVAAILPARRAARIDVLRAVSVE